MARYLITHSLLSSWLYAIKDDPYEDATTERDKYAEFMTTLNRLPSPPNEAMQNGIDFENLVTQISDSPGLFERYAEKPRWYDAARDIADIVRGGQFQFKARKAVSIDGMEFVLFGKLDVLKAGSIYDIKFSKSYDRGKYYGSTQHPMYLELVPEAQDFTYLVSNGADVWTETYTREETRSIFPVIADFADWLRYQRLFPVYAEKWAAL